MSAYTHTHTQCPCKKKKPTHSDCDWLTISPVFPKNLPLLKQLPPATEVCTPTYDASECLFNVPLGAGAHVHVQALVNSLVLMSRTFFWLSVCLYVCVAMFACVLISLSSTQCPNQTRPRPCRHASRWQPNESWGDTLIAFTTVQAVTWRLTSLRLG